MKLLLLIVSLIYNTALGICQNQANENLSKGFSMQVTRDTILLGNFFDITFNIENIKGDFEPPDFSDFNMIMGPNHSSSVSIFNDIMIQIMEYSYRLKPRQIGKFYILESYLKTNEGLFETEPISIVVLDNPEGVIQENKAPKNLMNFGFENNNKSRLSPDNPTISKKIKLKTRKF